MNFLVLILLLPFCGTLGLSKNQTREVFCENYEFAEPGRCTEPTCEDCGSQFCLYIKSKGENSDINLQLDMEDLEGGYECQRHVESLIEEGNEGLAVVVDIVKGNLDKVCFPSKEAAVCRAAYDINMDPCVSPILTAYSCAPFNCHICPGYDYCLDQQQAQEKCGM